MQQKYNTKEVLIDDIDPAFLPLMSVKWLHGFYIYLIRHLHVSKCNEGKCTKVTKLTPSWITNIEKICSCFTLVKMYSTEWSCKLNWCFPKQLEILHLGRKSGDACIWDAFDKHLGYICIKMLAFGQ